MAEYLFHGGVAGLKPGDTVDPDMAHERHVDGCPFCEAHGRGENTVVDPLTPAGWVYATADRQYGRYYASRAVFGSLYRVELDAGSMESSTEDHFPSWRARSAVVTSVLERGVQLTMRERRRLFVRWGGTKAEARAVLGGGHVVGGRWMR